MEAILPVEDYYLHNTVFHDTVIRAAASTLMSEKAPSAHRDCSIVSKSSFSRGVTGFLSTAVSELSPRTILNVLATDAPDTDGGTLSCSCSRRSTRESRSPNNPPPVQWPRNLNRVRWRKSMALTANACIPFRYVAATTESSFCGPDTDGAKEFIFDAMGLTRTDLSTDGYVDGQPRTPLSRCLFRLP